jgi:2',3'-cyclic-nucleotide 2'-phosphodiesterase (5'-nucleotidase family)
LVRANGHQDLHDGAGISDATVPNGNVSNAIWDNVDYDLLTIGNHELYVTEIAYETFSNFSKVYGERYLTSNVQIKDPVTGDFEYIGNKYRYFTTEQGSFFCPRCDRSVLLTFSRAEDYVLRSLV